MSDINPLKVAMIGCGKWGRNIARNLAQLGVLAVICDADRTRGEAMASDLGATYSVDLDEVLSRADIAAVAIATPAVTHAEVAGKALAAGKHVFVEKPIAMSVIDAERLALRADDHNLTLMTGHLLQYHPIFVRLLSMVREGTLGRLNYVYSNRLNQGRIRTEENSLWSLAPHDISMLLALAGGKPSKISAVGHDAVQKGLPDLATVMLEFPEGVRGHIFCSWLNPYKEHRLAVIGDQGMAVFDDTQPNWEDKLVLYRHKLAWKGDIPEFVKADGEKISVEKGEPLREEIQHFLDCVAGKTECRTGPAEAIPVLKVLTAAQRSMDGSNK